MSITSHKLRKAMANVGGEITVVGYVADGNAAGLSLTGLEQGDLVLICHADAGVPSGSLSLSVTVTDLGTTSNAQSASRLSYYVVQSGVTSVSATTGTVDGGALIALRGVDTTSAPEFTSSDSASGNADPAAITPTGGIKSSDYIILMFASDRSFSITGFPTGYTNLDYDNGDVAVSIDYKTGITAASEDPPSYTNTSDGWAVYTIHAKAAV